MAVCIKVTAVFCHHYEFVDVRYITGQLQLTLYDCDSWLRTPSSDELTPWLGLLARISVKSPEGLLAAFEMDVTYGTTSPRRCVDRYGVAYGETQG